MLESRDAESIARHANDREIWLNLRDLFPHPYTLENAEGYIRHVSGEDPPLGFGIGDLVMPRHEMNADVGTPRKPTIR